MIFDPTYLIEPTPGAAATAAQSGAATTQVWHDNEYKTCFVAGPPVDAGNAVSVVRASGIWWAVRRERDTRYPNGFPRALSAWGVRAPHAMVLRYMLRGNKKRYRYATVMIDGFDGQYAQFVYEGERVRAPVVWGNQIATVAPDTAALAVRIDDQWRVIGRPVSVWEWEHSDYRTYDQDGDYDGPEVFYDDYTYTHSEGKRVEARFYESVRDTETALDPAVPLSIGESMAVSGAIRTTARAVSVATRRRRYYGTKDPNAQRELVASYWATDPAPPIIAERQAEVLQFYIDYPVSMADSSYFIGPALPPLGWQPSSNWEYVNELRMHPTLGYPVMWIEFWFLRCEVYDEIPAVWRFTETTYAKLTGVYK